MSEQNDQHNDPVFDEEQAHLKELYAKLLRMRDDIAADLESNHAGARQDLLDMSEEVTSTSAAQTRPWKPSPPSRP